jgi:enoyl reductase-like protein
MLENGKITAAQHSDPEWQQDTFRELTEAFWEQLDARLEAGGSGAAWTVFRKKSVNNYARHRLLLQHYNAADMLHMHLDDVDRLCRAEVRRCLVETVQQLPPSEDC